MSSEKSDAIVLRVIDFSETSCIVTLFTRDFGKITAMAKGARRPKNPFEAAIDVLAICRIVFLHKTSGAMDLLTESKLDRRFRSSATDLGRLYAAYYVVELLRVLTEEKDPHPEVFDLAQRTIVSIDDESNETTLNVLLLEFELKALRFLGHFPMLTKCTGCGRERKTQNQVDFGLNAGGLLCRNCRAGHQNVISLSPEGVNLLLRLASNQAPNWNDESSKNKHDRQSGKLIDETMMVRESGIEMGESVEEINLKHANELRRLINKYITHLLGFPPRMHKFLKQI